MSKEEVKVIEDNEKEIVETTKEEEKKEETVPKKDFEQLGRSYFQNQVFIFEAFKMLRDVGHNLVQQGSAIQELLQKNENLTAVAVSEVLNRMNQQQRQNQVNQQNKQSPTN